MTGVFVLKNGYKKRARPGRSLHTNFTYVERAPKCHRLSHPRLDQLDWLARLASTQTFTATDPFLAACATTHHRHRDQGWAAMAKQSLLL